MKKKVMSMLLVCAMGASLMAGLTGCGNSGANSHKLTAYAWDANFNIPALEAAAAEYKAEVDPEFELEIITQADSKAVETAMTLAGNDKKAIKELPDIVLFQDHYIQQYVDSYPQVWVAVDDANCDWSQLGAEKLSYSTIGGKHYGFPVDAGTAIMAYRTDLLAECGYTIEDVTGITWERFTEIAVEVKAKTGKYLLCMDGDGNDLFYMMLQAEGVSQFKDGVPNITGNQALVDVFTVLADMCEKDVLYLSNDWSGYTDGAIVGDQVAGVLNGNWIIPTMKQVEANSGKWAITCMPTLDGHPGYASNGGSSLYVTANCKNTDLAKDFLAYTFGGRSAVEGNSETYDNALLNGGVIGTCLAAAKSDVYQQGVDFFNGQAVYADIVAYTGSVPTVEQSSFHYDVRKVLANALTKVKNGEMDIPAALEEAETSIRFTMGL